MNFVNYFEDVVDFGADASTIDYFTNGFCNALAWEIHRLKGYSLAMVSDLPAGSDDYFAHVFVVDSEAYAIDITGRIPVAEMRANWSGLPYYTTFFSDAEFNREMILWYNQYNRNKKAKYWAKLIVDILDS